MIIASLMPTHQATPISSWEAIVNRAASSKKKKYKSAAEELRGSFTPLVCSTDAVLHREYASYQKRLASRLASKWEKPYSVVMTWFRGRTQFAGFSTVNLRLRGSRRRLVGLNMQDGIGIGHWPACQIECWMIYFCCGFLNCISISKIILIVLNG